jgi:hypothetical protein
MQAFEGCLKLPSSGLATSMTTPIVQNLLLHIKKLSTSQGVCTGTLY